MKWLALRMIAGCATFIFCVICEITPIFGAVVCETKVGSCPAVGSFPGRPCTCHGVSGVTSKNSIYHGPDIPHPAPPSVLFAPPLPQVLTTRNFFGPHDIPPLNFAAYGIVAFPQKFTTETRHRHISICEAYIATLPPASSSSAPPNDQMVTVWPIDNTSLAERLNEQGESVCKEAVEHYDLNSGLIALREAATQEKKDLSGRGPYLLAWAPSSHKGTAGSLVLIADLSSATTAEHYRKYFQKWRADIERNPKLWRNGWSQADLIAVIRDWADKWGTMILSVRHADGKNE